MAKDILTIRQLEDQLERRKERLEFLKKTNAPGEVIATTEKDIQLTTRRLERALAADYDEEIETVQQIRCKEQ